LKVFYLWRPGESALLPDRINAYLPAATPSSLALVSQLKPVRQSLGGQLKDQYMKRISSLAVASIFGVSTGMLFSTYAGPYSSPQANTNIGAVDPGVGGFVTSGGVESGTASGNSVNPRFVGWATSVIGYSPSPGVSAGFQTPLNALGPVGASPTIVSLGDIANPGPSSVPGQITLSFSGGIGNGAGADFAVFENGFVAGGKLFAEFAYVEVSSDGIDFARFASVSQTPSAVGAFGTLDSTGVYNLAGKHAAGWGTPFDLSTLANDSLVTGGLLDLGDVRYVRLVDIPGSGFYTDSLGHPIYDAYPTTGSGGFDLDAIGVLNAVPEPTTPTMVLIGALLFLGSRRNRIWNN
jgi:hypothetical protein